MLGKTYFSDTGTGKVPIGITAAHVSRGHADRNVQQHLKPSMKNLSNWTGYHRFYYTPPTYRVTIIEIGG